MCSYCTGTDADYYETWFLVDYYRGEALFGDDDKE